MNMSHETIELLIDMLYLFVLVWTLIGMPLLMKHIDRDSVLTWIPYWIIMAALMTIGQIARWREFGFFPWLLR